MVEQVLPRIYRIHVPLPGNPLKELNSYLIRDEGHSLLIDTGFRQEACRAALEEALTELGVRREELDVLATHRHTDHCGMADLFVGPNRRVYMGEIDAAAMDPTVREEGFRLMDVRFAREGFPKQMLVDLVSVNPARSMGMPARAVTLTPLQDGDVLQIGGYELRAIHTPGHTPGHLCFWLEEQKAMFLGDHVLFNITPNIAYWEDLPDALGAYLDSLKKIREYDVEIPLPAHRMQGNFRERVDSLLAHHAFRLNETLQIVRENPGLCAYEITARMTWSIRCRSWEDFPLAQKWFAMGECLSHLDRLAATGQIRSDLKEGILHYDSL